MGKSFALNHLVDTSFAGSAMRTTGVVFNQILGNRRLIMDFLRGCLDVCDPDARQFNCCVGFRRSVHANFLPLSLSVNTP